MWRKTVLAYHQYATREEAIEAVKLLWHDVAQSIYGLIENKENEINILGNV